MIVFGDGIDEIGWDSCDGGRRANKTVHSGTTRVEVKCAFLDRPTVITALKHAIQFLYFALPNVAYVNLARQFIDAPTVGIAETVGVNLIEPGCSYERIIQRHSVLAVRCGPAVHIDADQLSENIVQVLAIALWRVAEAFVIPVPAVAQSQVEEAVGAKMHHAAVVIELGLVDAENFAITGWINAVHVRGIYLPFGENSLMIHRLTAAIDREGGDARDGIRSVCVEEAIRAKTGMESETEQAAFVISRLQSYHPTAHIQKRNLQARAVGNYINQTNLIKNKQSVARVIRCNQTERRGHAVRDGLQLNGDVSLGHPGGIRVIDRCAARLYGDVHRRRNRGLAICCSRLGG